MKKFFCALGICLLTIPAFAADNLSDMFANATFNGEVRMLKFSRNFDNSALDRDDQAFGGKLEIDTDSFKGISFGVSFLTSNDVNSNDNKIVYGLLKKDDSGNHESYTKLGQYFIQGHWFDTTIRAGSQELETPFANKYDFRMTPKEYKGLSVVNTSATGLKLSAYYINQYQEFNSTDFVSISKAFSSAVTEDKPLYIGGVEYSVPQDIINGVKAQVWTYYMPDVYSLNYVRTDYKKPINADYTYNLKLAYIGQKSVGDELAGDFEANSYGFVTGFDVHGVKLEAGYARTQGDALRIPFGDQIIIPQVPGGSFRADEDAYMVGAYYDFTKIGLTGLYAYSTYGIYNTPETGSHASPDYKELDVDVTYAFSGFLKGFKVRARNAFVNQDEGAGGCDYNDTRLYAIYSSSFGGKK